MESHNLTELIVELYRRLNQRAPEPDVIDAIAQLREDNGLDQDDRVPLWLTAALEAAVAGREVKNVLFPKIGSDVASFLMELAPVIPGWNHHDEGEWVAMDFPALRIQIYLSREALSPEGIACSSYTVRPSPG